MDSLEVGHILRKNFGAQVTDDRLQSDRAQLQACGGRFGRVSPPAWGSRGHDPRENFYILDARMCILEFTQRRIGIVMRKNIAAEHLS